MPSQPSAPQASSAEDREEFNAQVKAYLDSYLSRCKRIHLGDLPVSFDLYEFAPDVPSILFIPGIGTYCEYYCEYLSKLSASGFNVLAMDIRGHGYSAGSRGCYTIEQTVTDMQLALDYLGQHYPGQIGVVGHSIGARLALALAEADSRVESLLCHTLFLSELPPDIWHAIGWQNLAFSTFWMPGLRIDIRSFIDVQTLLSEFPIGRYALEDERMVWSYPLSTLHSVYSARASVMQRSLGISAAVIIGEQDRVIRREYVQRLLRRTRQHFEYLEVPGEGHMMPLSDSGRMVRDTGEWFQRTL